MIVRTGSAIGCVLLIRGVAVAVVSQNSWQLVVLFSELTCVAVSKFCSVVNEDHRTMHCPSGERQYFCLNELPQWQAVHFFVIQAGSKCRHLKMDVHDNLSIRQRSHSLSKTEDPHAHLFFKSFYHIELPIVMTQHLRTEHLHKHKHSIFQTAKSCHLCRTTDL